MISRNFAHGLTGHGIIGLALAACMLSAFIITMLYFGGIIGNKNEVQ